jgi:hypothetical protein
MSQDYRDYYRNATGRTTTPRPRGQRSWWDNVKEAFVAPADGSAPGMATGSGSTVPTTPGPGMSETQNRGYSSYDVATGGAGSTVNTTTPGPSGPVTGSSGYSLYGMADGELKNSEIERINDIQAGTTTAAPGGTTTAAPGETTTPAPDEIDGIDLEQAGQDAYQRNLANILGGIDTRKQAAGEGFSDLYQQFQDQKNYARFHD